MAHKQVLFRSAAREKILRGATQLADAVRITLGPKSKSVLIEKKWGPPARLQRRRDHHENLGARMLRQAAEKTGEVVGDGTSTTDPSRELAQDQVTRGLEQAGCTGTERCRVGADPARVPSTWPR